MTASYGCEIDRWSLDVLILLCSWKDVLLFCIGHYSIYLTRHVIWACDTEIITWISKSQYNLSTQKEQNQNKELAVVTYNTTRFRSIKTKVAFDHNTVTCIVHVQYPTGSYTTGLQLLSVHVLPKWNWTRYWSRGCITTTTVWGSIGTDNGFKLSILYIQLIKCLYKQVEVLKNSVFFSFGV